ncbi:MAG: phosphatidate cytidylyltransferase [Tissierellia bacterium]|nr:phosphatidate cytidylyltransferase [Tissierellia bacterium]
MNKLITRTISGIGLVLLVLFFTLRGGLYLFWATAIITAVAAYEFHRASARMGYVYPLSLQLVLGFALNVFVLMDRQVWVQAIPGVLIILSMIYITFGTKYRAEDMMMFLFSFLYINYLLSYMLRFESPVQLQLVYCCAWGTDTFAYLGGAIAGRHKLIERLSPNKTIEGSISGVLGSVLVVYLLSRLDLIEFNWGIVLIAVIGSIMSQIGDLSASYIKRRAGIKDYGNIIMGHGGVLDRFDSILFAIPTVYILTHLLL